MRTGWKRVRLGDLVHIKHGYAFKGEYFADAGPFVVLTPGNFYDEGGFKSKQQEKHYTGEVPKEYVLHRGDLLIAMTEQSYGLLGSSALIPIENCYLHNQRLGLVVGLDEDVLNKQFLYYLFNTSGVRNQIQATATGSKVRHTSPSRIGDVEVLLPRIAVQQRIAAILSAYDDLIENNTRRIAILEEMAQALYREWFVNFRFPGHEDMEMAESELGPVPAGWEMMDLFDLAEVTYGFPFQSKLFSCGPEGLPVIRIRDILPNLSQTFTLELADNRFLVRDGDLLIGMDGDFHSGKWAGGSAYLNQRVARLRSKGRLSAYHLFLALQRPIDYFNATIAGTTVAHLGDKHLRQVKLIVPPLPLTDDARRLLDPIFELEINLRVRNRRLRQTRDLLLPKLISGEIEVPEAEDALALAAS